MGYQPGNIKITNDVTNLTIIILFLTVQVFFQFLLFPCSKMQITLIFTFFEREIIKILTILSPYDLFDLRV
jgi:hypothetical protein